MAVAGYRSVHNKPVRHCTNGGVGLKVIATGGESLTQVT